MWILFISSAWRPCCKITCMCSRLEACFQNCTGILLHISALPILQSVTGWNPAQGGRFLLACTTLIMWVLLHNCVHSCPLQRSLLLQVIRIRCQANVYLVWSCHNKVVASLLWKGVLEGVLEVYKCICLCMNKIHHVMPREKRWELWTAVSGLLALISRAYHNFSLWHHQFIKAKLSSALVVLN